MSDYGALVGRWWAVWYKGDIDTLDEILAEKFVRHGHTGTVIRTRQQAKADMLQYRESMEIADVRIEAQAVSGDSVWSRVTTTGVRRRTEEPTTVSWLQLCRVEDGRLAEMWMLYALGIDWSKR